jgi:hypothetical protein
LPTIEDIFNYVFLLKQQLAQKDQIIQSQQEELLKLKKGKGEAGKAD